MLCGIQAETLYAKPPDAVSHNVISVMLQIRASDLAARHQRVLTNQALPKQTRVQQTDRLTYSQELISCVPLYSTVCLQVQSSKHTYMITSHKVCLSLSALLTSDKYDIQYIYCIDSLYSFKTSNTYSKFTDIMLNE